MCSIQCIFYCRASYYWIGLFCIVSYCNALLRLSGGWWINDRVEPCCSFVESDGEDFFSLGNMWQRTWFLVFLLHRRRRRTCQFSESWFTRVLWFQKMETRLAADADSNQLLQMSYDWERKRGRMEDREKHRIKERKKGLISEERMNCRRMEETKLKEEGKRQKMNRRKEWRIDKWARGWKEELNKKWCMYTRKVERKNGRKSSESK